MVYNVSVKEKPVRLTSTLPTERGPQIMATAAKHFARKVAVEEDANAARIAFPAGTGVMAVVDNGLALTIDAASAEDAEQVRDVFEGHLLRFAHRENPQPLVWAQD